MTYLRENRNLLSERSVVLRSSCFTDDGSRLVLQSRLTYEHLLKSKLPWEMVIEMEYQLIENRLRTLIRRS